MEEKEFAEIVSRTKGVVLSAIEKNLASRFFHAIDDVAQETYLRAYKGLLKNQFRGDSSLETWLYTIARNESQRMNKKLMREEEKALKSRESHEHNAADEEEEELISALKENLSRLPEKYGSVLTLISSGHSISDISEMLSIRPGTVKSRASRGRKILQKIVRQEDN